jgi:hypothetical protein
MVLKPATTLGTKMTAIVSYDYETKAWYQKYRLTKSTGFIKWLAWYVKNANVRIRTVDKLPVEHRIKPANLLGSPTARALQLTEITTLGWCYSFNRVDMGLYWDVTTQYYGEIFPTWMLAYDSPPWELAMRLKIKAHAVNLADTIGEWRESVEALESGANLVKQAYDAAKKRKEQRAAEAVRSSRKKARRPNRKTMRGLLKKRKLSTKELVLGSIDDVIGADLAIKFGVKPYLSLADDLQAKLAAVATEGVVRRLVVTVPGSRSGTAAFGHFTYEWSTTTSKRAVVYVKIKPYNPVWTAGNPLEALWAGTTLSFMVDWFWDFGSYLSSIDAMNDVDWVRGTLTTRKFATAKGVKSDLNLESNPTYVSRSIQRDVITSIPIAQLPSVRLPEADLNSLGKLVSSMEILYGLRRKFLRR